MKDISYALGMTMAGNFLKSGLKDIDLEAFAEGMGVIFNKQEPRIAPDDARKIIDDYFNKKQDEMFESNKTEGAAYLAENKKREGVTTTESGLQYEILKQGTGKKPSATDTVVCHYEGKLLNGQIFDSSYQRNQPAEFPLNRVIPGWTEGLQLMPVGSKFRFHIPSELGYGAQQAGELITPNSTLVFDVELLEIK